MRGFKSHLPHKLIIYLSSYLFLKHLIRMKNIATQLSSLRNSKSRISYLYDIENQVDEKTKRLVAAKLAEEHINEESGVSAEMAIINFEKSGMTKEEAIQKTIEIARKKSKYFVLGGAYAKGGDFERAGRSFRLYAFSRFLDSVALQNASSYFERSGLFKEAADCWNLAFPNSPGSAELYEKAGYWRTAAVMWDSYGDYKRAINARGQAKGTYKLNDLLRAFVSKVLNPLY